MGNSLEELSMLCEEAYYDEEYNNKKEHTNSC